MYEKIKKEISDIISIVKVCPENLQEKCFEVLLTHLIKETEPEPKLNTKTEDLLQKPDKSDNDNKKDTQSNKQNKIDNEEITLSQLHIKTRKLLEQGDISIKDFNNIYYIENGQIKPLYEELGTHKMSDSQIRLTLLSAFENGLTNGEFEVNGEYVRQRCQDMKCYDVKNFTHIFARNKNLFDGYDKYNKDENIKLSSEGKNELLNILKYLLNK